MIARHYTREAGVRKLEQQIGTICRKLARRIAEGKPDKLVITPEVIHEFLGGIKVRVDTEIAERTKRAGVAVGLAWTPAGGDVLFIEANRMRGKGGFTMTGQIGDVMKESMQAALTWVRSNAKSLGLDEDVLKDTDLHIHVPAGAIPKDGPSAGVTMATALVSLLTDTPVHPLLAMTGEITLSGNVLPVGGIKEKFLAAKRAGVRDVILPTDCKQQVDEDLSAGPDRGRDHPLREPHRRRAGHRAAEDGARGGAGRSGARGSAERSELIGTAKAELEGPASAGLFFLIGRQAGCCRGKT